MDRFLAIDAFVRVAETESFAEAARQMRVSRSVVTARIQQLEAFVGAPLFHRNTRRVRLRCGAPHRLVLGLPHARAAGLPRCRRTGVARHQAGAAQQLSAPVARVRARARRHRVPADLGGVGVGAVGRAVVLSEYPLSAFSLSVFYPSTVRSLLKLKLFLDVLIKDFADLPPWDQALIDRGLLSETIID
jgi:Bacterial regulatory helix-turn-helix protein, lysR family